MFTEIYGVFIRWNHTVDDCILRHLLMTYPGKFGCISEDKGWSWKVQGVEDYGSKRDKETSQYTQNELKVRVLRCTIWKLMQNIMYNEAEYCTQHTTKNGVAERMNQKPMHRAWCM